ncbi:MAG: prephenate dehydratase [Cyclobacteriaceae bacterium]|nr:MAG: prephenate dehydratase [Cyclobacteriaceae bacterium]
MPMINKLNIAIQGAAASFHHQAAELYFDGQTVGITECRSFEQVCDALDQGKVDYAMMAIENTFTGSLLPNYGLLQTYPLHIIGEQYLHIEQHLMAIPGQKLKDIKYIHSHPIALNQCNVFLEAHPQMVAIEKYDTAGSAREIDEDRLMGVAAIAGIQAAELYHLEVLAHNIENLKENQTRFLVLSRDGKETEDDPNKASVCLETAHKVGSLMEVLQVFYQNKINITKIQSVPIPGKPYQYQFHLDLEWGKGNSLDAAMLALDECTFSRRVLGVYKKGLKDYDNTNSQQTTTGRGVLLL